MATNARNGSANRAAASKAAGNRKMSAKQREARKKRKLIIFVVEIIIILIMLVLLLLVLNLFGDGSSSSSDDASLWDKFVAFFSGESKEGSQGGGGPHLTVLDEKDLVIDESVKEQTQTGGAMYGYTNIALFGVDAKNNKDLFKNSRSDTIMIASINMETGDIKLVSVYRDSYLNLSNDYYNKCNGAYSRGGAAQAIAMLNMNLDMNITEFITVGYAGLAKVIDGLGGVYIDVDKDELKYINDYQYSILGKYAKKYIGEVPSDLNFTPDDYFVDYDLKVVSQPGYQLLNGLQAAAYCRIRYVGNDFQRTERQREVIKAIEAQAKKADIVTLTKVFNSVTDDIYTNMDWKSLAELLPKIADYKIVDESGFPELNMRQTVSMGAKGSCEIPVNLESSVAWLHQFLFNDEGYQVSDTVKEINKQIQADADKYRKSK